MGYELNSYSITYNLQISTLLLAKCYYLVTESIYAFQKVPICISGPDVSR